MRPEVVDALPRLVASGTIRPDAAAAFLAEARGERITVRPELRLGLYLGVLLVVGGVGLLVKENYESLGPLGIALLLGLAAAACLVWVIRKAPPFSWEAVPSPHLAFDYLLLLGLLLAAADLAFIEWKLTALGDSWPWHLLLVSLVMLAAAVRYDSRVVFSLALSTFAAWRGVAVVKLGALFGSSAQALRWNALACGLLFLALGWACGRWRRKPHFAPAALHLGWLLILGALISGLRKDASGYLDGLVLLATACGLAVWAFRGRRFGLFAFGAIAAYVALTFFALSSGFEETLTCFWFAVTPLPLVIGLIVALRRMRALGEPE